MIPKIYWDLSALGICDGKEPTNDALQPFRSFVVDRVLVLTEILDSVCKLS